MFDRGMQRLDIWDLALTKLAVALFVLAAIARSPALTRKVQSQNSTLLLLASLAVAARPTFRFLFG